MITFPAFVYIPSGVYHGDDYIKTPITMEDDKIVKDLDKLEYRIVMISSHSDMCEISDEYFYVMPDGSLYELYTTSEMIFLHQNRDMLKTFNSFDDIITLARL